MLTLYNSLTQAKEKFIPIHAGKVLLYVCGITVYDYCHLGHARTMIFFDLFTRFLRSLDYDVCYVRNITDIDDKIIKRANERGVDIKALTTEFSKAMHEDERALGLDSPSREPRATDYIPKMIEMIGTLIEKGLAYQGEAADSGGDVYFAVKNFRDYGKLSKRQLDDMAAGARVDVDAGKRDPMDFVLWKQSKKGEPAWPSPWGEGRPGWHIECSTMSSNLLGKTFDIHGGGVDLKFPHHENEIAQSEGCHGCPSVHTWMHAGHLQIDDEKMSKSLNNFITIREALEEHHPEVIKTFLLLTHYRRPVNYSDANMHNARQSLERLYTALRGLSLAVDPSYGDFKERFNAALCDDINTPEAMAVLFDMVRTINTLKDDKQTAEASAMAAGLQSLGDVLGLLRDDPERFLQGDTDQSLVEQVEALISQRNIARQNKEWATADKVRDAIDALGVVIEDGSDGTTWRLR